MSGRARKKEPVGIKKDAMDIRVCPNCDKVFYVLREDELLRCTHCEFALLERRERGRERAVKDIALTLEDECLKARLQDYSSGGLRATYRGSMLNVETEVFVALDPAQTRRRAVTLWSKKKSGGCFESGFRFIEREQ